MPDTNTSLRAQILIAMPSLYDPNFSKTITLICEHSVEEGAMGIILNQPTSLNIYELIESSNTKKNEKDPLLSIRIHSGGPVDKDHGFILHDCDIERESTIQITPTLFLTSSSGMLDEITEHKGPDNKIIALGYAGWSPGQLEAEISANSWLTTEYQHQLVFNTPADKQWLEAGKQLGIDLNLLNSQPGHA
ncbi:MAG: YqgE/AlgH family protein [Gammaproteobacteria bacterium]